MKKSLKKLSIAAIVMVASYILICIAGIFILFLSLRSCEKNYEAWLDQQQREEEELQALLAEPEQSGPWISFKSGGSVCDQTGTDCSPLFDAAAVAAFGSSCSAADWDGNPVLSENGVAFFTAEVLVADADAYPALFSYEVRTARATALMCWQDGETPTLVSIENGILFYFTDSAAVLYDLAAGEELERIEANGRTLTSAGEGYVRADEGADQCDLICPVQGEEGFALQTRTIRSFANFRFVRNGIAAYIPDEYWVGVDIQTNNILSSDVCRERVRFARLSNGCALDTQASEVRLLLNFGTAFVPEEAWLIQNSAMLCRISQMLEHKGFNVQNVREMPDGKLYLSVVAHRTGGWFAGDDRYLCFEWTENAALKYAGPDSFLYRVTG